MKVYIDKGLNHDYSNDDVLFELDKENGLHDIFKTKNKVYVNCAKIKFDKEFICLAKEIEFSEKGHEYQYTSYLKCPYCKYEFFDESELYDESDEFECNNCGSVFAYERDYEITYNSKPVEANKVFRI